MGELDLRDARLDLEDAVKGKADLDKTGKLLQGSIVDSNTRLDEMARALNEAESTKKRLQVENQDLNRQIEELEAAIANMNKGKISVSTQLEDTKSLADAEAKDRAALLTKFKMMSTDLENLREKLENEAMRKSDALKALSKAQAEIQLWKSRYETEGLGRIEELEGARNKLQAKIVENAALKGGKAAMSKMEGKIRELEAELAATQSRSGEAMKAFQRAERKAKELNFAQTEDKKNQDRMSELASKLQMKLKTYKQQIEEAEEIA